MRLNDASLKFTDVFCYPPSGILSSDFSCFFSECFYIIFDFCLCGSLVGTLIVPFLSKEIVVDVVKVSPGFLLLVFCFTFSIPSFPTLHQHKLISDTVGLGLPLIIIVGLEI